MGKKTFKGGINSIMSAKSKPKSNATLPKLKDGDTRTTLILKEASLERLKVLAWVRREPIKKALDDAIVQYISTKKNKALIDEAVKIQQKIK